MDGDDGPKDGGTGKIGLKPSTDATACQTPTQSGIPAWMLARNNSVHAPVFGQPSARKSASCKLPSMPSSAFLSGTGDPPLAELQAEIPTRNDADESKASPPPPKPSASVEMEALNDAQALALLLKNETVAGVLQNAFNARVEEHQHKLAQAYNQRLLELEEYTRSWRDATKELWSAINEGKFNLNNDQRDALLWKGPQDAGIGFNPEPPTAPQAVARVTRQEWIKDTEGRGLKFSPLSPKFRSIAGVHSNERLLFRTTDTYGNAEYRPFRAIRTIVTEFNKHDVFIDLSRDNIGILGKAFCYLKERRDHCFLQFVPDSDLAISPRSVGRFYDYFSAKAATTTHLHALCVPKKTKKRRTALQRDVAELRQRKTRLLIARPCFFNEDGKMDAIRFLDVGSDMRTARHDNEQPVVLFEDKTTLNLLAQVLEFTSTTLKLLDELTDAADDSNSNLNSSMQ